MFLFRNKYFISFLTALCFLQTAFAQHFPQLYFENITTSNGLSDNVITCMYEDKNGALWIGTANGLNRYDGNNFQTFFNEEGNKNSLSGNVIVDIIEDKQHIFWIATKDGGLTRYDPSQTRDKQFMQFRNDSAVPGSLVSNRMTALLDLDEDYILISAEKMSVGYVNKKSFKITYNNSEDSTYSMIDPTSGRDEPDKTSWVHHFCENEGKIYYSALGNPNLSVFNKINKEQIKFQIKGQTTNIANFVIDAGVIWYGSWSRGLYKLSDPSIKEIANNEAVKYINIDAEITYVTSLNENILLAGSKTSGLYLVDKKTENYLKVSHDRGNNFSLASNRINCLLKDSRGIVWIGTTMGISKYNPVQWQFNAYLMNNNFEKDIINFSPFFYNDKSIGICSSNGIYKYEPEDGNFSLIEFSYTNKKLNPTSVISLENGRYYLNTESATFWYDPVTNGIQMLSPETNINLRLGLKTKSNYFEKGSYQVYNTIFDTIEGHPIQLFATIGWGMGLYDTKADVYYDLCSLEDSLSISNNFVRVIYKDSKKNIWVGTSEGLNKWNKSDSIQNKFERFLHTANNITSISHNTITGLYEDKNNVLWIATGNGINKFDGKGFKNYTPSISQNISMYGLYADKHNNLWTAVRGGFQVFNLETETFRYVPVLNNEWLLKNPATILQQSNGEWFYGAGNYLVNFNPDNYYFENNFPQIYLTDFLLFDKHIYSTAAFDDLTFNHNDNFITIAFSSLQLSQPGTVKYKYQLAGLNNEWIDIGNNGKISFTSLPAGKYILNLKVTNPLGVWSNENQLVEFIILKPYWQQWWFFLLCGIIAGGIIYSIIKYRERQFIKLQKMRNKIANDLHDDVGSTLSTINLYSEVAKMKSNEENNELKNILDKISNSSIEMQENMNHIVWSLQPRNDNFEQMMMRMKSYALENLQVKNIVIEFNMDEKLNGIKLSPEKRKELFLIYKEAIHNITKYANCSEVKINFQKLKDKLEMKISDNGKGFDINKTFSGNGLHTMQERAKSLRAEFNIVSGRGAGTTIILRFEV